jgi:hypothetical protein
MRAPNLRHLLSIALLLAACDDKPVAKPTPAPSASAPAAPASAPSAAASADKKPAGPQIVVDDAACVIDGTRYEFAQPDPRGRISAALTGKLPEGQPVELTMMRETKAPKVGHVIAALRKAKAAEALVRSQKRDGKMGELAVSLAPIRKDCSVVAFIAKDNATSVWTIGGGTANRFGKGMAGPDNTLSSEKIRELADKCDSGVWYVGLDESHTWAKAFDLALAAKEGHLNPTRVVYLPEPPVPGRKVSDLD